MTTNHRIVSDYSATLTHVDRWGRTHGEQGTIEQLCAMLERKGLVCRTTSNPAMPILVYLSEDAADRDPDGTRAVAHIEPC